MDPISHALVGTAFAGSRVLTGISQRRAMLAGVLAGMSPDLDILIRSAEYPLLAIKFHRHFTHALPVAPLWGGFVAFVLWALLRWKNPTQKLLPVYLISVLAVMSHGILDSLTNYGTHLFWPLTDRRESWSMISIVDPIFTLTLLATAIIAAWRQTRRPLIFAIGFMLAYWSLGYYQREQATSTMHQLADQRGHTIERAEVKPSIGNLLVWRVQYLHERTIYIDAVHHSPWAGQQLYAGGSLPLALPQDAAYRSLNLTQQKDLADFAFFSDGWLTPIAGNPLELGDARFGMLPQSLDPLWAITLSAKATAGHAGFENLRRREPRDLATLWQMVKGQPLK